MTAAQASQSVPQLNLAPPEAITAVAPAQISDPQVTPEEQDKAIALVRDFMLDVDKIQPNTVEFAAKSKAIQDIGREEIKRSAASSSRLTQIPMKNLEATSAGNVVAKGLGDLRNTLEELDPSKSGALHGLMAKLPFQNRIKRYFRQYESADKQIQEMIKHLLNGQDQLEKDNESIKIERVRLWNDKEMLESYIFMTNKLQQELEATIKTIEAAAATDANAADRARELRDDLLFNVVQKRQDLITQLAVTMQGYMAYGLIFDTNNELIKGVDRATTTTVAALQVAVGVAQALNNQKLVLDSVNAVNELTSSLVASTARQLAQQVPEVYAQAGSSTVKLEDIQSAFNDIFTTMDAISTYKEQAVEAMTATVDSLELEVSKAQKYMDLSNKEKDVSGTKQGTLKL